jgi:hypothetical protein
MPQTGSTSVAFAEVAPWQQLFGGEDGWWAWPACAE